MVLVKSGPICYNHQVRRLLTLTFLLTLIGILSYIALTLYQNSKFDEVKPVYGEIIKEVSLPGTVEAEEKAELSFKISGEIASISAQVGDQVKQGDLLVTLDRSVLWQSIQQAYADLNVANSDYYKAKDKLGATRETYKTDPHSEEARTAIGQDQTAADAALFALEKKRSQVKAAEETWADSALYAPFDGEVVSVSQKVGERVSTLDTDSLITLVNFKSLYFRGELEEKDGYSVKVGQDANLSLDSFPDETFSGKVVLIEKEIKKSSSGNKIIPIRITLEVPPDKLSLASSGDALISIKRKENAQLLPKKAVFNIDGRNFVKVKDRLFIFTREYPVMTGLFDGKNWEIISGLDNVETILVPKN